MAPTAVTAKDANVLCEIKNISQEFTPSNGMPLHVLENINLVIRPKEIVALLGPTGCGKSTILRILAGLLKPTHGEVFYHSQPLTGLNPGIAIVFQSFALLPWKTMAENVQTVLYALGLPQAEIDERTTRALRMVGLAGFEDWYPRACSGGMKQRGGIARALTVDPEILLLDEPFSQVDALTAESLRAEVIDLWAAGANNISSILMVSHDIKEVVYMADRIVVLSANPGQIRTVMENRLPRPRDYRSPEFLQLVDQLHDVITRSELPDAPPLPTGRGMQHMEPLPEALPSQIVGLLEYLDARGGREEIFRIAADTNQEFGRIINIVEGAELLELVDTPKRMVVLEQAGQRLVRATPDDRKGLWRTRILKLRLFKMIYETLKQQAGQQIDRDFVLETIVMQMPQENYEKVFETFLQWAHFGNLFEYDETTEVISLVEEQGG
jgi:NitT/TauT family transport system ATP-binding protein